MAFKDGRFDALCKVLLHLTWIGVASTTHAVTPSPPAVEVGDGNVENPLLLAFDAAPDSVFLDVTPDHPGFFVDRLDDDVVVVSSWLLFHMLGSHIDQLKPPKLPHLVSGIRDAIADSIEVCRPAVGIIDMRAVNFGSSEPSTWLSYPKRGRNLIEEAMPSIVRARKSIQKTEGAVQKSKVSYLNVTQVKVVYEVRIFEKMHVGDAEVARRIDKFQIYSHFADLSRLISRSLARADPTSLDSASLDDTGYAARHVVTRRAMSDVDLSICGEEWQLQDARRLHQYVMALAFLLLILTTCAGSAVFTLKYTTATPSRWNPLMPPSAAGNAAD
mmetsp:Transcript_32088/g.75312  ORF Transcript_32088/g.75312 Transcript_32088/m.75312 type:complete len:330 (+) Transcript_32088:64-1053(+)